MNMQNVLRTRIASSQMLTKTKKYTINHRKAGNEMKKFRQNLKRKGKHVVKCVTKSNIVAQLNKNLLNKGNIKSIDLADERLVKNIALIKFFKGKFFI